MSPEFLVKVSFVGLEERIDLEQFLGYRGNAIGEFRFAINDPAVREADAWLVIEATNDGDDFCIVPRQRLAYLGAESAFPAAHWVRYRNRRDYLNQFGSVHTWYWTLHRSAFRAMPFLPWMVNSNHGPTMLSPHTRNVLTLREELPTKTRKVSVICSNKAFTRGHEQRLRFVERLKSEMGNDLDWFGNGIRPLSEKWQGLAPYEYSICIENRSARDAITEKLHDAYLAGCFPIYWGAPNVNEYYDRSSLAQINSLRSDSALRRVMQVIESGLAGTSRDVLSAQRERALEDYNFARRLHKVAKCLMQSQSGPAERLRLAPLAPEPAWVRRGSRLKHAAKNRLNGLRST